VLFCRVLVHEVATWYFNSSVTEALQHMKAVKGSLKATTRELQSLNSYSDLESPMVDVAAAVAGEMHHVWSVAIPAGDGTFSEVMLPHWATDGVDSLIARWLAERTKWDEEKNERAAVGKGLAPKRQMLYDQFVASSERRCCLQLFALTHSVGAGSDCGPHTSRCRCQSSS
jgi:hypothetical protein